MIDAFHRDIAAAIRPVLTEPGRDGASREGVTAWPIATPTAISLSTCSARSPAPGRTTRNPPFAGSLDYESTSVDQAGGDAAPPPEITWSVSRSNAVRFIVKASRAAMGP